MEISDNGQGFGPSTKSAAEKQGRLGLIGMKERAEMIGGKISMISGPRRHTVIRVQIKIPPTKSQATTNPS